MSDYTEHIDLHQSKLLFGNILNLRNKKLLLVGSNRSSILVGDNTNKESFVNLSG